MFQQAGCRSSRLLLNHAGRYDVPGEVPSDSVIAESGYGAGWNVDASRAAGDSHIAEPGISATVQKAGGITAEVAAHDDHDRACVTLHTRRIQRRVKVANRNIGRSLGKDADAHIRNINGVDLSSRTTRTSTADVNSISPHVVNLGIGHRETDAGCSSAVSDAVSAEAEDEAVLNINLRRGGNDDRVSAECRAGPIYRQATQCDFCSICARVVDVYANGTGGEDRTDRTAAAVNRD